MRSGLGGRSGLHMLLDLPPLLSIELQSHQEPKMLILCPPPHPVLVLYAAALHFLLLLRLV